MKKYVSLTRQAGFLLLLATVMLASCNYNKAFYPTKKEIREVALFTSVELKSHDAVYLRYGPQPQVEVETGEGMLPQVLTYVENGKLVVGSSHQTQPHRSAAKVYVTVPYLSKLHVSGGGRIVSEDTFTLDAATLLVSGHGDIEFSTTAEHVVSRIEGTGNIKLSGKAGLHVVEVKSAGHVRAFDLVADYCTVNISGSGSSYVYVKNEFDIQVSGTGSVRYRGQPLVHKQPSVTQHIASIL